MARRKSARKPAPKKRMPKLDTKFTCPFCNHAEGVECTIDKKLKIGEVSCRICSESFCTKVNFLTEAIDIYSEWLDACEAAKANVNNISPTPSPIREEVSPPRTDAEIEIEGDEQNI